MRQLLGVREGKSGRKAIQTANLSSERGKMTVVEDNVTEDLH